MCGWIDWHAAYSFSGTRAGRSIQCHTEVVYFAILVISTSEWRCEHVLHSNNADFTLLYFFGESKLVCARVAVVTISKPPQLLGKWMIGSFESDSCTWLRAVARVSEPKLSPVAPFAAAQFDEFLDQIVLFAPYFGLKEGVKECLVTVDKMLGGVKTEFIYGDQPMVTDLLVFLLNSVDDVKGTQSKQKSKKVTKVATAVQNHPKLKPILETKAAPAAAQKKGPIKANIVKNGSGGRLRIEYLLAHEDLIGQVVEVRGWAKTTRVQGGGRFAFLEVNDGSTNLNLQVVLASHMPDFDRLVGTGISVSCKGQVVSSPGREQSVEMKIDDPQAHSFHVIGECDQKTFPLSKKEHTPEYLREIAHLRSRTELIGAVARMRNSMAFATHSFFQSRGFLYVHTPIITASDCEGAGEMFQVTTILGDTTDQVPKLPDGKIDYSKDFFKRKAYLTVSGQLDVETYCCGLSDVYTFGPTFRAENSHTTRHLAEFWMIEPELAFAGLEEDMECAESYLKYCIKFALDNNLDDLNFFEAKAEPGLVARLKNVLERPFARVTYTEAVELVRNSGKQFSVMPNWGDDLQSEHERYISEEVVKGPVIVYNYPRSLKSFYMLVNEDGRTVQAMDILVPKIGEVIGGSVREHRYEKLEESIAFKGLNPKDYWWYQDLRTYGSVPHCGFGLGFERLVMMVSGVENIRDVIPFPRWPGHAEF